MSKAKWKFSKDCGCYYQQEHYFSPPEKYCMGDRMIHCDFGLDSHGVLWRGSTPDNWHGWDFGYDLKKALEWVKETKFKDFIHNTWL